MSDRRTQERPLAEADPASVRVLADLLADAERYVIEVDLPGVRAEEVQVVAVGDSVVVEGKKEERRPPRRLRPSYQRAERDYGPFRRVFRLPGPADLSQATASLGAGVLRVSVPRIVDRRGRERRIRVTVES